MSETYMERKVQQQAQIINELIIVLDKAAMVFGQYEMRHYELGTSYKATAIGYYKKMCLDVINKAKVAELESRILFPNEPLAKWQPKGGDWRIDVEGNAFEFSNNELSYYFGTARQTKEQAQRAAVEMRRFNRLLALRDELCGDEVVDWKDLNKEKHHVYFSYDRKIWHVSANVACETITPYFTTTESAQKACDMLNSGEVEL